MRVNDGFTIIEVLIALAILGVALASLAGSQVTALRINQQSSTLSEAKAEANRTLEGLTTSVLAVEAGSGNFDDDGEGNRYLFVDYYWSCPTKVKPKNIRGGATTNLNTGRACTGDVPSDSGAVLTSYAIRGEEGVLGEGVVNIAVTSTHTSGVSVTVGTSITCFEVYPSPTSQAPIPCPEPLTAGGGRSQHVE